MHKDPNIGWLVAAYTEIVVYTAAFIIQEAYDEYRILAISPYSIRLSREMDLLPILGNQAKVDNYLGMFLMIAGTNLICFSKDGENGVKIVMKLLLAVLVQGKIGYIKIPLPVVRSVKLKRSSQTRVKYHRLWMVIRLV